MDFLDQVTRVNPEVGVQRVRGRLLAAGPEDVLHSFEDAKGEVSEVAERIVELADGVRSVRQIVDALCEEFEVSKDVCVEDTQQFVRLLMQRGILLPVNPPADAGH